MLLSEEIEIIGTYKDELTAEEKKKLFLQKVTERLDKALQEYNNELSESVSRLKKNDTIKILKDL